MFELRAAHTDVHQFRADGFELSLSLFHVGGCGHASLEAALRQVELALQIADCRLQQLDLRIEAAQLEVVRGHFGLERKITLAMSAALGLRAGAGGLDSAADAAPEIGLPRRLAAEVMSL